MRYFALLLPINVYASLCTDINLYSKRYDVSPKLIESIIFVESQFVETTIGDDGKSIGLMQIQLPTARDMKFKGSLLELIERKNNIKYGTKYLAWLKKTYSLSDYEALDAYNRGYGNVSKWPWKKSYKNHRYVGKIIKYIEKGDFKCLKK